MRKQDLIHKVRDRGYPLTEGALRVYLKPKYKFLQFDHKAQPGTSRQYTDEQADLLCEIIAVNRLGIRLSQITDYLSAADKQAYLLRQIMENKRQVQAKHFYFSSLLQLIEEVQEGKYQQSNASELYLKLHL